LCSHQNRKGAEVRFATETRGSNLRRISSPKSEYVRRTWIPTTCLVTAYGSLAFVQGLQVNRQSQGSSARRLQLVLHLVDELIMMSVYVPMDVDVSIDVGIPIKASMDVHVSTVVISGVIPSTVVIPTASRNYNHRRAVAAVAVAAVAVAAVAVITVTVVTVAVVAAPVIATGSCIRIIFTRLKSQSANNQR
jgi:hypothetical protein